LRLRSAAHSILRLLCYRKIFSPLVLQNHVIPTCVLQKIFPRFASIFSPARLIPAVVLQNLVTPACVLQKEFSPLALQNQIFPLSYKINPSPLSLTYHHALRTTHHALRPTFHNSEANSLQHYQESVITK
jgi:hypothetical protein